MFPIRIAIVKITVKVCRTLNLIVSPESRKRFKVGINRYDVTAAAKENAPSAVIQPSSFEIKEKHKEVRLTNPMYKKNLGKIARRKVRASVSLKTLKTVGAITKDCNMTIPLIRPERKAETESKLSNI